MVLWGFHTNFITWEYTTDFALYHLLKGTISFLSNLPNYFICLIIPAILEYASNKFFKNKQKRQPQLVYKSSVYRGNPC